MSGAVRIVSSALAGVYTALGAKGDVPYGREVGGSVNGVVVQRWYRERLVGDAATATAAARGEARGAREARVAARGGAI